MVNLRGLVTQVRVLLSRVFAALVITQWLAIQVAAEPEGSQGVSQAENDNTADSLWVFITDSPDVDENSIPVYQLQTDASLIKQLGLNRSFAIPLPEFEFEVAARLTEHYQILENTDVYEGPLQNMGPQDHVIITQGLEETHVVVSTEKGVFSARINNETGLSTLVNESQANPELGDDKDFILAPRPKSDASHMPMKSFAIPKPF